ncbi:hypothetical protein BT93_F2236 [Corymbia citriodora subsp. variegata]|nr:hypothetical protein BT93_F2236 [Corymbia citriodora subsp. variegata]
MPSTNPEVYFHCPSIRQCNHKIQIKAKVAEERSPGPRGGVKREGSEETAVKKWRINDRTQYTPDGSCGLPHWCLFMPISFSVALDATKDSMGFLYSFNSLPLVEILGLPCTCARASSFSLSFPLDERRFALFKEEK